MTIQQISQSMRDQEIIEEHNVIHHTRDDSSFGDQTTTSSDTSGNLHSSSIPILVSIESPLLSATFIMLNSANCFRSLFSNYGKDIVQQIHYDPEWWRYMQDSHSRSEKSESEWHESVRIEFQILSAFLCRKMDRSIASTANLESLFRVKKDRSVEHQLEITTIFKILSEIPEISELIMVYARIDGEVTSVLPIPINTDHNSTLSKALDETFWGDVLESDEFEFSNLPVLESIPNVLIVNPLQRGIEIERKIWPEKYGMDSSIQIQQKLRDVKELKLKRKQTCAQVKDLSAVNGRSVLEALELSAEALRDAGYENSADELLSKKQALLDRIDELNNAVSRIDADLSKIDESSIVFSDDTTMAPYILRSILWFGSDTDGPLLIFRSETSEMWNYLRKAEHYEINWEDVKAYAENTDNYLLLFERDSSNTCKPESDESLNDMDSTTVKQITLAPSVQKFIENDNKYFSNGASGSKRNSGDE